MEQSPQPTKTQAIKKFLTAKTYPDLANLYNFNMEVQVNVARDNGEAVINEYKGREWKGFTDGIQTWKSFRIPLNAKSEPVYDDKPVGYDLEAHVEGIGMTGWDWVNRHSLWCGFDFDAIIGHNDKHKKKLTDEQIKEVQDAAFNIPWITVRKSTGGRGLHLYIFLDGVYTENHTEHGALARAILGKMSAITGFDFASKVDICGGNMWVWHRKMIGTDGLKLIKQGEVLTDVPPNWRDHVKVVSGRRHRVLPHLVGDEKTQEEKIFDELTGQHTRISLDVQHRKLIDWLNEQGYCWQWDQDNHMLITHTYHLKEAHDALQLRGIFETISTGREAPNDINCFAFPLRGGSWVVRRFSPGVQEADSWDQDSSGWTRCFYNREPDLPVAAKLYGGLEDPAGGYVFREAEQALKAANALGVHTELPAWILGRGAKLRQHRSGRLIFEIDQDKDDVAKVSDGKLKDWLPKKKTWVKMFHCQIETNEEVEVQNNDDLIRHLVTVSNEDYGWVIHSEGKWIDEPLVHVRVVLASMNYTPKEVNAILGGAIVRNWTVINAPFQPEYPGNRQWNRHAPQFRFHPSTDTDNLTYPHWNKILNHIGRGLNEAVKAHPWCRANGIDSGADYLKCWIASLFQQPKEPLPYLFLHGPENSGKSILHEALELLVTCGCVRADTALISQQGFNYELENAVLCVVEETDLRVQTAARNRIKDWVTSRMLPIHRKGSTVYHVQNTTHWIQCSNDHSACPILPGDTRITMVYVDALDPSEMIPKRQFITLLEKEASDFLAAVLSIELPQTTDRLNLPIIETDEKRATASSNMNLFEIFLSECCYEVPGKRIKFSDLYDRFREWLPPEQWGYWTKNRMGKELPPNKYPKGRSTSDAGQFYVGNISFDPPNPDEPVLPRLKVIGENNKQQLVSEKGVE